MRVDCAAGPNNPTKPTKEAKAMNDDINQRRTGNLPSGAQEQPCIYTAPTPEQLRDEQVRRELRAMIEKYESHLRAAWEEINGLSYEHKLKAAYGILYSLNEREVANKLYKSEIK